MQIQQLKDMARIIEITDYAFNAAIKELKDEKRIATLPGGGKGNRKILKLTDTIKFQ